MNPLTIPGGHRAFTVVELLVVIGTIAIFSFLVLQSMTRPRVNSQRISCLNHLRNVGLAFRIFATDNQGDFPMAISTNQGGSLELISSPLGLFRTFVLLSNELSTPKLLFCSEDRSTIETTNFQAVALASTQGATFSSGVSYFLNPYADERQPQVVLAGDRHITNTLPDRRDISKAERIEFTQKSRPGWTEDIHKNRGNVALSDGSVMQINSSTALRLALAGKSTNRTILLFPGRN